METSKDIKIINDKVLINAYFYSFYMDYTDFIKFKTK